MPYDTAKELYTVNDLVESGLGSRTTIWRKVKAGRLKTIKTETGRVFITAESLKRYIDECIARAEA